MYNDYVIYALIPLGIQFGLKDQILPAGGAINVFFFVLAM